MAATEKVTKTNSRTKLRNTLLYTLAFFAFVSALLYTISPNLLTYLIQRQLNAQGIHTVVAVQRPNSHQLTVDQLDLTIPAFNNTSNSKTNKSNQVTHLSAAGIEINYDIWQLLLKQEIQSISVTSLLIQSDLRALQKPAKSKKNSANPLELKSFLPSQLISSIPVTEINVKQVILSGPYDQTTQVIFKGLAKLTPRSIEAAFDYIESATSALTLDKTSIGNGASINYSRQSLVKQSQTLPVLGQLKATLFNNDQFEFNLSLVGSRLNTLTQGSTDGGFSYQGKGSLRVANSQLTADIAQRLTIQAFSPTSHVLQSVLRDFSLSSVVQAPTKLKAIINTDNLSQLMTSLALNINSTTSLVMPSSFSNAEELMSNLTVKHMINIQVEATHLGELLTDIDLATAAESISENTAHPPLTKRPKKGAKLDKLTLNAQFSVEKQQQILKVHWLPKSKISLMNLEWDQSSAQYIDLELAKAITLETALSPFSPQLTSSQWLLRSQTQHPSMGSLSHQTMILDVESIDFENPALAIELVLPELKLAAIATTETPEDATVSAVALPFATASAKNIAAKIAINQQKMTVALAENLKLDLQQLKYNGISTPALWLQSHRPIILKYAFQPPSSSASSDTTHTANYPNTGNKLNAVRQEHTKPAAFNMQNIQLSPLLFKIGAAPIKVEKNQWDFQEFEINLTPLQLQPLNIKAQTTLKGIRSKSTPLLKKLTVQFNHHLNQQVYRGDFTLTNAGVPISIEGNIKSQDRFKNVAINWKSRSIKLAKHAKQLSLAAKQPLPKTLKVLSGSYRQSGKASIQGNTINAYVWHTLSGLQLSYNKINIDGVSLKGRSHFKQTLGKAHSTRLSQSGKVTIKRIATTPSVDNISTSFHLSRLDHPKRSITINQLQAHILGATVSLDKLATRLTNPKGESQITFKNLPLNSLLALEQQPSLTGTGILEGRLPFRFNGNKIWVDQGKINAIAPGTIHYKANQKVKALAATNVGLDTALQVLENFHYDQLSVDTNYRPDGQLLLKTHLAGKNPNWQAGQPINFSVNIEENLLKLLQTLQFSDDLNEKIQQRLK